MPRSEKEEVGAAQAGESRTEGSSANTAIGLGKRIGALLAPKLNRYLFLMFLFFIGQLRDGDGSGAEGNLAATFHLGIGVAEDYATLAND